MKNDGQRISLILIKMKKKIERALVSYFDEFERENKNLNIFFYFTLFNLSSLQKNKILEFTDFYQ